MGARKHTIWTFGLHRPQTGPTTAMGGDMFAAPGWPYEVVLDGMETVAVVPAAAADTERGSDGRPLPGSETARARLIAAAPDLLEAGSSLLARLAEFKWTMKLESGDAAARDWDTCVAPAIARLQSALSRATGEKG